MRHANRDNAPATVDASRPERHTTSPNVLLAAVLAAALVTGCGAGSSPGNHAATGSSTHATRTTTVSATTKSSSSLRTVDRDPKHRTKKPAKPSMLAFAKCMRAHGVPDFPDPTEIHPRAGGQTMQTAPNGGFTANPNSPSYQRASKECHSLAVASPVSSTQNGKIESAQLKFSACMRTHGVPNYPDPTSTGEIGDNGAIPGVNENSPAFQAAEKKCDALRPRLPGPPGTG